MSAQMKFVILMGIHRLPPIKERGQCTGSATVNVRFWEPWSIVDNETAPATGGPAIQSLLDILTDVLDKSYQ